MKIYALALLAVAVSAIKVTQESPKSDAVLMELEDMQYAQLQDLL